MREGTERSGEPGDGAVSPVIAVILMVAITVVLAATVYVWVSGFTDTGDQAPNVNFGFVSCDISNNGVTVKMNSGGPLQQDDAMAILYNQSTDEEEGRTDPLTTGGQGYDAGQWNTGEQKTISESSNDDFQWDSNLANDLDEGNPYSLDFVHKPTESTFATLPFSC